MRFTLNMAKISSSSSSSVSSPCGGFAQRRVAKLQAKKQAKIQEIVKELDINVNSFALESSKALTLSTATSPSSSSVLSAGSQRTDANANTYYNAYCRLHSGSAITPAKCLLLAGLFLSLSSSSFWPSSGVLALPRHMHGRHLILPHHHIHLRSADTINTNTKSILIKVPSAKKTSQSCFYIKMSMQPTRKSIQDALNITEQTKGSIQCLLEEWLMRDHDLSLKMAIQRYSLHQLDLEHPLTEAVKTVKVNDNDDDNDGTLRFRFETTEIGTPVEELSKILDSLEIVRHLINSLKMPKDLWSDTFAHISEKMLHNIYMASSAMGIEKCDRSAYTYNNNHANVIYAVGLEAIKLLTVIQGKYQQMLKSEGLLLDDA